MTATQQVRNSLQTATPSLATRVALSATLIAAFVTVFTAGFVSVPILVTLCLVVVVAQVVGLPAVLGHQVRKVPMPAVALLLVFVAVWAGARANFALAGVVLCLALFALCLDWNSLARLSLPFLLAFLLVTASTTRGQLGALVPMLAIWVVIAVTTLVLMERDAAAAGRPLRPVAPTGPTAGRLAAGDVGSARRPDGRRHIAEIAIVSVLVLVLVPLISLFIPQPGSGRPNRLGDVFSGLSQSTPYWGFNENLDTSVRGELDDEVVMRIQAAAPDFWRGTTFDRWDGRRWTKSTDLTQPYPGLGTVQVKPSLGDVGGTGETFKQVVTVERAGSDLVFGAYRTTEVEMAEPATIDRSDGTVRAYGPLAPGSQYTVISRRANVTADRLRNDDPLAGPIPKVIAERYLQLPAVPDRVRDLAAEVTAGQPTTYDKVRALEAWMGANTTYTRDIPRLPEGVDAVEQHLFVDRSGFCEQIATSLTVMLRSQGIPARLAVGFVPSDRDPISGEYTVRSRDAHAWVEVWFPQTGWQAFDPTASVPLSGEYHESTWDRVSAILRAVGPWVAVLLGTGAALVLGGLAVRTVRRRARRRSAPWAGRATQRLLAAGARRGRARAPGETLVAYAQALSTSVLPDPRVAEVGRMLSAALFSAREPTDEQRAWITSVLDEVEAANPPRRQRRDRRRDEREARRAATTAASSDPHPAPGDTPEPTATTSPPA